MPKRPPDTLPAMSYTCWRGLTVIPRYRTIVVHKTAAKCQEFVRRPLPVLVKDETQVVAVVLTLRASVELLGLARPLEADVLKIISAQDFRPDRRLIRYSDKTAKQMVSGTMLLPGIWSSAPCSTPPEPEFRQ